nr:TM2 domain-containing protein [Streptomyces kaniharaensis]
MGRQATSTPGPTDRRRRTCHTRSTANVSYPPQPGQQPYPGQPYPGQPYPGQPEYSDKSKIVAGILQLFLGGFGIGRFYTGHIGMGIAQLLTCGGFGFWALIDGIMFLVSNDRTDAQGRLLRG